MTTNPPPPGDPTGRPGDDQRPDDADFEYIEGEIVDDDVASGYGGTSGGRSRGGRAESAESAAGGAFNGSGPFDHPDPFGPASALGGNLGAFGALRMLATGTPEVRTMLAAPLRLLSIAVAVPSLIALLFGFTIDGDARFVAFVVAALGGIAAVVLEVKRSRFVRHGAAEPSGPNPRRGGLLGLIAFSVFAMMLAIGFDLLAVLLQLFGVW